MCGYLNPLDVNGLSVCDSCLEGKMTMMSFKAKGHRAKEVLTWFILIFVSLLAPVREVGTSISSLSLMITHGTDIYT